MSDTDRDREALLRVMYDAFNARDIERVLEQLDERVDWPNAWEGGRLLGREAVRDYWTRQWAEIDPHIEAKRFTTLPDGRVEIEVHQIVRTPDGVSLSDGIVTHVYAFGERLISRMDVSEPDAP